MTAFEEKRMPLTCIIMGHTIIRYIVKPPNEMGATVHLHASIWTTVVNIHRAIAFDPFISSRKEVNFLLNNCNLWSNFHPTSASWYFY